MMFVERTKRCARCGEVKPWSAYRSRTRWEDGSTRTVRPYCRPCENAYRIELGINARAARAYRERKKREDPDFMQRCRDIRRMDYAMKAHAEGRSYTPIVRAVEHERGLRVPIGPFRDWLRERLPHHETLGELADAIASSERALYRWLYEHQNVIVDNVHRALVAEGSTELWELYPDLYGSEGDEEAQAA